MTTRSRSRSFPLMDGTTSRFGNTYTKGSFIGTSGTCNDSTGPSEPHDFEVTELFRKVLSPLDGNRGSGSGIQQYSGYIPGDILTNPTLISSPISDNVARTRAQARSNPSRKTADFGTFVGELRDFPGMAKDLWSSGIDTAQRLRNIRNRNRDFVRWQDNLDTGIKDAMRSKLRPDKQYLANQFGWKPFLKDMITFFDTKDMIDRRLKELESLAERGSKSSRITIDNGNILVTFPGRIIDSTYGASVKGMVTEHRTYKKYATVRWKVQTGGTLFKATKTEYFRLARRLALGIDVDYRTAYNLMPWSWLMDWAGSLGDWLEASANTLGVYPAYTCVMETQQSTRSCTRTESMDGYSNLKGGNFVVTSTRKTRHVLYGLGLPEAYTPILDSRQASILSSLATTRIRNS